MNKRKRRSIIGPSLEPQVRAKTLRTWGLYLLTLLAWMATAIVLVIFCAMLPWSATPFYEAILWLRDYIVLVLIVFILGGWVVISYFSLALPKRPRGCDSFSLSSIRGLGT